MWVRFRHSTDLPEIAANTAKMLALSMDDIKSELRRVWPELRDAASAGELVVRGKQRGTRRERQLSADDLRNCLYFTWRLEGGTELIAQIERYDEDTYKGAWDADGDDAGFDFVDIVVKRADLLRCWPVPKPSLVRRRGSNAAAARAEEWLREQLATRPPKSVVRGDFLEQLVRDFGLSKSQASLAWRNAVSQHPEWSLPGRRRKSTQ
jgi:hypothetical protein